MIHVHTAKEKRQFPFLWVTLAISLISHVVLFHSADDIAQSAKKNHGTSRVEFRARAPKKPPTAKPKPPPTKPPVEKPKPRPKPKLAESKRPRTPKPNTEQPPPEALPAEPAKQVFGASSSSVTNGESGVSIRVGNTLAKEMERDFTKPKEVAPLPPAPPPKAAPPTKKRPKPVPVYELSKAPSFKKKIEPKYPEEARRAGVEGTVQLEVLIDEKGKVQKIRVLKNPGFGLDRAAIAAASKSRFHPGIVGGKAVPVKIKIPYRFVLDS